MEGAKKEEEEVGEEEEEGERIKDQLSLIFLRSEQLLSICSSNMKDS